VGLSTAMGGMLIKLSTMFAEEVVTGLVLPRDNKC